MFKGGIVELRVHVTGQIHGVMDGGVLVVLGRFVVALVIRGRRVVRGVRRGGILGVLDGGGGIMSRDGGVNRRVGCCSVLGSKGGRGVGRTRRWLRA